MASLGTTLSSSWHTSPASLLEKPSLRIGFVPLTDCAPLVVAKERGFFRRHGLDVTLSREPSWATVRDGLTAGLLDGTQLLAPMALASRLGGNGLCAPMIAPLSLGLGGNAITVSNAVYEEMLQRDPDAFEAPVISARPLRRLIESRAAEGRRPLVFAVVFPFSPHNYELRYWLGEAGIHPDRDLEIVVAPPSAMVPMLAVGRIDGYCVGEPWNQHAGHEGVGRTIVTKHDIWSNAPEKVFAVTEAWAERHPRTLRAVLRALLEAAEWLDRPENTVEVSHVIAGESYVDAPVEVVLRSLRPSPRDRSDRSGTRRPSVFYRYAATFPWRSHAAWFVTQMLRWGQIDRVLDVNALVQSVYRPDLYCDAAGDLAIPHPSQDRKVEGLHDGGWMLEGSSGTIAMGADAFLDRRVFDPTQLAAYLRGFEVASLRVSLDELERRNRPAAPVVLPLA